MIYLTTGANGSGKTLNTLKVVREKQVKEGRSVYYHGFSMKPEKATEFGWLPCDPTKWQDLPDGSIVIADECQEQFPVRRAGSPVPDYVEKLAVHRKRGFDFFFITQHPQNIDLFLRRLIGPPGYHVHLKRNFGMDMVSRMEWGAVCGTCEKSGAGKDAKVSLVPFPKEVYEWYDSAVMHTGKKSIPPAFFVIGAAVVAVPLLFWFTFTKLAHPKSEAVASSVAAAGPVSGRVRSASEATGDYVAAYRARIPGLDYTAPRYDKVTDPVDAPLPAACMSTPKRCECFSQQGTRLQVPDPLCRQIVAGGFFVDFERKGQKGPDKPAEKAMVADKQAPAPFNLPL